MATQVMILLDVEDAHADKVASVLASNEAGIINTLTQLLWDRGGGELHERRILAGSLTWDTLLLIEKGEEE